MIRSDSASKDHTRNSFKHVSMQKIQSECGYIEEKLQIKFQAFAYKINKKPIYYTH